MGAAGSDVAIETADVALMADELERLPWLLALGARTLRVVRQNIVLAIALKGLIAVLGVLGLASLWVAVAVGDMGLSLVVIGNALRLGGRAGGTRAALGANRTRAVSSHPAVGIGDAIRTPGRLRDPTSDGADMRADIALGDGR